MCLPFLKLFYGEDIKYFIALFYFRTCHFFHAVFFDLTGHFLDEVLCLNFEEVLDRDLLAVGLRPEDEGLRTASTFEAKLLVYLHLLEVLSDSAEIAHFQQLLFVELEKSENYGKDKYPAPPALIEVQLFRIALFLEVLFLALAFHRQNKVVQNGQDVSLVADPAREHCHDPLRCDHFRLHLEAFHKMYVQSWQVLLQ